MLLFALTSVEKYALTFLKSSQNIMVELKLQWRLTCRNSANKNIIADAVDDVWVFDVIKQEMKPSTCFLTTVTDRKRVKLLPIIKKWIIPGTSL